MKYQILFLEEAASEYQSSFIFYELRKEGLGVRFKSEVRKVLELISSNPFLFEKRSQEFREAPLHQFPFVIVYHLDDSQSIIEIVAVFHSKRSPMVKEKRLKRK